MQTKKLIVLVVIWAISILLFTAVLSPNYLVEKTQEVLNFDFPSKEDYVSAVEFVRSIVGWFSVLYFAALAFLTFRVFQPQGRFQFMQTKKLIFMAIIWAISIFLFTDVPSPSYLVEKTQGVLNFDFASKEDYVNTVEMVRPIVGWFPVLYSLYFAALTFLTVRVFQRQERFQ